MPFAIVSLIVLLFIWWTFGPVLKVWLYDFILPPTQDSVRGQWVGTVLIDTRHYPDKESVRHAVLQLNIRAVNFGFNLASTYHGDGEVTVEGESAPRPISADISVNGVGDWNLGFTTGVPEDPLTWTQFSDSKGFDFPLKLSPGRIQFDNSEIKKGALTFRSISGDLHKGSIEEYRKLSQLLLSAKAQSK